MKFEMVREFLNVQMYAHKNCNGLRDYF